MPPTRFDDTEVDAVYESAFGGALFNLYTGARPSMGAPRFYFTARVAIVRAMIRAMLDAEAEQAPREEV